MEADACAGVRLLSQAMMSAIFWASKPSCVGSYMRDFFIFSFEAIRDFGTV